MEDKRKAALAAVTEMIGPEVATAMDGSAASTEFGGFIGDLALRNVFGELWTRPELDRRSRSLVTLGLLIALRAHEELQFHFPMAVRNGVSVKELEEVIYQASAYAGFPAAASARNVAKDVLRKHDLLG